MATITLSNSGTYYLTQGFLQEFGDVGDDGKFSGDSNNLRDALYTATTLVSGVHRGLASDNNAGLVGTPTFTASKIAFTTTGFSSDDEDILADLTIKGSKLVSGGDQAKATSLDVEYISKEYQQGQPHTEPNLEKSEKGLLTHKISYAPAAWANAIEGDATAILTEQSISNKSTNYEQFGGTTVKYENVFSRTIKGNITLRDDVNFGGFFSSIIQSSTKKGDDGSQTGSKLSLNSKAGLALDEIPSVIDRLSYSGYDKANSISYSFIRSGPDDELATALGQFLNRETTVSDVAAVMLAGSDKVTSAKGNNLLNGYGGNDMLIGGKGDDVWQFTSELNSLTNVDRIQNFKKSGNDSIQLSGAIFAGYRGAQDFIKDAAPTQNNACLIYNSKTGALSYDSDGSGPAAAVQFATLVGKVTLTASDISII